jgi:hypothetical protein
MSSTPSPAASGTMSWPAFADQDLADRFAPVIPTDSSPSQLSQTPRERSDTVTNCYTHITSLARPEAAFLRSSRQTLGSLPYDSWCEGDRRLEPSAAYQ